ncbi:unnamed protein product [Ectocarpus sp. 12 AP-2014]
MTQAFQPVLGIVPHKVCNVPLLACLLRSPPLMIRCIIHTRDPTRSGHNPLIRGIQTQEGLYVDNNRASVLPGISTTCRGSDLHVLPCPWCEAVCDAARWPGAFGRESMATSMHAAPRVRQKRGRSCAYIRFFVHTYDQQRWWLAPLVGRTPRGCVLLCFLFLRPSIHWTDYQDKREQHQSTTKTHATLWSQARTEPPSSLL